MSSSERLSQLRLSILDAAARLNRNTANSSEHLEAAKPGDLFVFSTKGDQSIECVLVREHMEDPQTVLVAPCDDALLVGTSDVDISEFVDRPMIVRCGETFWIPLKFCEARLRTDSLSAATVQLIRRTIGQLARGSRGGTVQNSHDADPEYQAWIDDLRQASEEIRERANQDWEEEKARVIFYGEMSLRLPPELSGKPAPRRLAAESGGTLPAALANAIGKADAAQRFHQIETGGSGQLFLIADDNGMQAVWSGPPGATPPDLVARCDGAEARQVVWIKGPQEIRYMVKELIPWIDGQVTVKVALEPAQTITIQW